MSGWWLLQAANALLREQLLDEQKGRIAAEASRDTLLKALEVVTQQLGQLGAANQHHQAVNQLAASQHLESIIHKVDHLNLQVGSCLMMSTRCASSGVFV